MLKLHSAHVFKYKSIENSSPVEITKDVTVLVGKNESGKTAFLEALHKALPLGKAQFNYVFDYPRKDYIKYRPEHDAKRYAKVTELKFRIGKSLVEQINREIFGGSKVIPEGHTITRTTTYGNSSTIILNLDSPKALVALKEKLGDIEHIDDVFNGAQSLGTVVTAIEKLELPDGHSLAHFAKEWRSRFEKATPGWDVLGWHIWNTYVQPAVPCFLYFDDYKLLNGKINLESLRQRQGNNTLTETDETVLGLFDLAGTSVEELISEEGYENSKAKLEAIGLTITENIFEFWKQNSELTVEFDIKADPKDEPPFNNGKNLYIRIKNLRHGVTVPFDQRSKGFIWFFSFLVWFSSVQNRVDTEKKLILLLDEPGLNLHALAQADFLAYIDSLAKFHQIIYSTHSPFMVASDRLENVRIVEDLPKEGTKITGNLEGSSEESLFPLQAALGYSIAQNLFISKKNLLVEGPADLILLQHISSIVEETGSQGLRECTIVPVGGLDKLATFVALLGANKLQIAVLHDRGSTPHQKLDELIRQKLIERKRVLDFSMFRTPENQETDIEDLFPEAVYIAAFNKTYESELNGLTVSAADLSPHPRIIERINKWLKEKNVTLLKDGGFNHYRVARSLLQILTPTSLSSEQIAPFEIMFSRINEVID